MHPASTFHILTRRPECGHRATVPAQDHPVVHVVLVHVPHGPIPETEPAPTPVQPVSTEIAGRSTSPLRTALKVLRVAMRIAIGREALEELWELLSAP
jgi:hypothetical protein